MSHPRLMSLVVVLLGLPILPVEGMAANVAETGEGAGFWTAHSVIFAKVKDVERIPSMDYIHGTHRIQVEPQATLSGSFDCARLPNLELGAWFGGFDQILLAPPTKGRYIVAVILKRDGEYFLKTSHLTFMPKGAGFVEVKDFSDPLVAEVLGNLQALRRKFPF